MKKLFFLMLLCTAMVLGAQNIPLELTAPNGGEQWQAGTPHLITWSQQNLSGAVSLHLISPLDNQPPLPIAMNIPVQAEAFQWHIPMNITPADFYQVMISLSSNVGSLISDVSDAPFSILATDPPPPPQVHLTVLNPNGGEVWPLGSTQMINWTSQGLDGEVVITLVQANGMADYQIATQVPIASNSFTWTVPDNILPGDGYRVHVMWLSNLTVYFGDLSDGPFSIVGDDPPPPPPQMLHIISPNGGEIWMAGTMHPITWVQAFNAILPVTLLLHDGMDPTVAPIPIAIDIPSWPSVFHWTLPFDLPLSNQYFVQISTPLADGTLTMDFSDGPFSIVNNLPPPPQILQLIMPNGGEQWMAGTMHPIRWQGHQIQGPLEIALMRGDNVQPALVIAPGIPNLGNFHWMIPANLEPASDYRMRIRALAGNLMDLSDAPFTIFANQAPPPSDVTLITPNGGETWTIGNTHTITWNAPNLAGPMQIWLLREGQRERYRHIISPNLPNSGSFEWTIPARVPPGDNYRILVRAIHPAWQRDVSDAVFSIVATAPKLKALPNRAGDAITISLDSQTGVSARVLIYNIRGQKVRDLGTLSLGSSRSVIWDAKDDRGQKASPGLYLIRARLEREVLSQRVMLSK